LPRLAKNYFLNFYGGEPLLNFYLIEKTLTFLNNKNKELKKKAKYSLTTNGSLLTEQTIQLLNKNKFSVVLSFDGFAQDSQRRKGSFKKTTTLIEELLKCPDLNLMVNSVFTPQSVDCLSKSVQLLLDLGVPEINFSFSILEPWKKASLIKLRNEIKILRKILLAHYNKKGTIPVIDFRDGAGKGIFYCAAGRDRLVVTPDEEIWGCQLFPEYLKERENSREFKKFFFGTLDDFIVNYKNVYPRIRRNYAWLSTDNYSTTTMDCYLCPELEYCQVCPINAAFTGSPLGKIPSYVCEIQRIKAKERKEFREKIKTKQSFAKGER
jgi:sulfatase maturation enzyme AslB (radical SAM superfamily)